jgi:hypothetical protein
MKTALIMLFSFIFFLFGEGTNYNNYEYELSSIVSNFKLNIMDKSKCEGCRREADYLSDKIEDDLSRGDYDSYEKSKLKKILAETEAVEQFISSVGNCGGMFASLDEINLANNRISASIVNIAKYNFCVNIYKITLGNYSVFMACNTSSNDYSVSYTWKSANGKSSGNGDMGLPKKTMRHIYDNREKQNQMDILFTKVTCKSF